jgi:hypothetical protein
MDDKIRFFLSIDQATSNLGWSLNIVKGLTFKPVKTGLHKTKPSLPNGERYFEKYRFINSLVTQLEKNNIKISYVVMEEVPQSETYSATRDTLNQLLGCFKMLFFQINMGLEILNCNHWKARAGLRSKDREHQKAEGIRRVKALYNIDVETDDVSDAILIGLASTKDGIYDKIIAKELRDAKNSKKTKKK